MAAQETERAKNPGILLKAGRITTLLRLWKQLANIKRLRDASHCKSQYAVYFDVSAEAYVRGVRGWSRSLLPRVLQVLADVFGPGWTHSSGAPEPSRASFLYADVLYVYFQIWFIAEHVETFGWDSFGDFRVNKWDAKTWTEWVNIT